MGWSFGRLGRSAVRIPRRISDSSAAFSSINSLLKPKFSKFARTFLKSTGVSFVSSDFAAFLEAKKFAAPLR